MTRPGCCAWPGTRAAWASRSRRRRELLAPSGVAGRRAGHGQRHRHRRRAAAAGRRAGPGRGARTLQRAGNRPGARPGVRSSRSRARARGRSALLPADGDPGDLALAAAGGPAPRQPGPAARALGVRGGTARRDSAAAAARARPLAAALARGRPCPRRSRRPSAGSGPETVALAGGSGCARGGPALAVGTCATSGWRSAGAEILSPPVCRADPAIGRGLRAALAAKLDGERAGREAELAEALRPRRRRPHSLDAMATTTRRR